jgi:phosphoserine phosphatase RsbU/P
VGIKLPEEHLPIKILHENKYTIMDPEVSEIENSLAQALLTDTFAAIALGESDQDLVSFSVSKPVDEEQLMYSLNTIRFVTNLKLKELLLEHEIFKAREIQLSLLPSYSVKHKGFDIYGRSDPAELVGGDAFDYLTINEDTIGICVLDAVGHGLPAALQARDAITGLRMGMAGNIKIDFMMMRLNQVIHKSNLSSRFVSLFYGELEEFGHLVYSNAGHPPPIFFSKDSIIELHRGGMVLGPNPKAMYKRGFAFFEPGDILIIFTDGIIEARNKSEEEFGIERVTRIVLDNREMEAQTIVEKVFSAVHAFAGTDRLTDDQTVVLIKRKGDVSSQF